MNKRVLLDENLPQLLRLHLTGYNVTTTAYQGWAGKLNGDLVALAEAAGFEIMVIADQNLSYQQNMKGRKLALVVLSSPNKALVLANAARIVLALNEAIVGGYIFINVGH